MKDDVQWANPGAAGLAAFGFTTLLLQLHNIGLMEVTLPVIFGFFWGGAVQVVAGIIDARRGDTFGFTAFTSFGFFWIALAFGFVLQWQGLLVMDAAGLGWTMTMWGLFTAFMTVGTFKMSVTHVIVFATLTVLFALLACHFFFGLSSVVPGVVGLVTGVAAVYGAAAVVLNAKYGRWLLPIGQLS